MSSDGVVIDVSPVSVETVLLADAPQKDDALALAGGLAALAGDAGGSLSTAITLVPNPGATFPPTLLDSGSVQAKLAEVLTGPAPVKTVETRNSIFTGKSYQIVKVEGARSMREAFELSGLDFEVEKRQLSYPDGKGGFLPVPGSFGVVRKDTNRVLGTVGSGYTPIRNWMGGEILDAVVNGSLGVKGTVENVGYLHDGARVFIQVKVGDAWQIAYKGGADEVKDLLTFTNSHDGSMKCSIGPTSIRIVCENTHLYANRESAKRGASVKHTKGAVAKVEQFAEELKILTGLMAEYRQMCAAFAAKPMTVPQMQNVLLDVFGHGGKMLLEAPPQTRTAIEEVMVRAESGKGNSPFRGTAWGLYNGVTEWVDHGGMRTRVPEGGDETALLVNSRLYGTGKVLKDDTFNTLRQFVKAA